MYGVEKQVTNTAWNKHHQNKGTQRKNPVVYAVKQIKKVSMEKNLSELFQDCQLPAENWFCSQCWVNPVENKHFDKEVKEKSCCLKFLLLNCTQTCADV